VTFKLCTLMHLIHTGCSPSYMSELVTSISSIASPSRLRSASSRRYEQPATRLKLSERSFAFAGPAAWNSLPTSLHEIINHKAFKRELKTVIFNEHCLARHCSSSLWQSCLSVRLSVCHKHALVALSKNGDIQEHQTF